MVDIVEMFHTSVMESLPFTDQTAIEQTGPVLYRVKVNDHSWKGHVKQVQNSYPCPPVMEVTDDRAVPEQQALDACCCMPAVACLLLHACCCGDEVQRWPS
ncbi:hypothetical protein P5673_015494 [Acropora cervicornis]|uniref:Uncharacterized protein n=1 Tax=Acropora cervicornis TaxID=6130 RepID=A0AAD9QHN7_ACRCE|nr:hypothetical protein P5673_015494 [Acropora cervicornis]